MTKKINACATIAFFAVLFFSCGKHRFDDYVQNDFQKIQLPDWDKPSGFFKHEDHRYGFDRHPLNDDGDSTAYISVLAGYDAVVAVNINKEQVSYDYFICTPSKDSIESIENASTSGRHRYTVKSSNVPAGGSMEIALCRRGNLGGVEKLQELHVRPYNWKRYAFDAYTLGDSNSSEDRHKLLSRGRFWDTFDSTFRQALVRHNGDSLNRKFVSNSKGYILTKGEPWFYYGGNYCGVDSISDVGRLIMEILSSASDANRKRAIIHVGYPTKRFWPLEKDDDTGNIRVCGLDSLAKHLAGRSELEPIALNPNCPPVAKERVYRDETNDVWKFGNGTKVTADRANPYCVVFAETKTSNFVGETNGLGAVAWDPGQTYASIALMTVEYWSGLDTLTKVAIHELGHMMGMVDLFKRDIYINGVPLSEENSIMGHDLAGYKLRKRGMLPEDTTYNYKACMKYYGNDKNQCMDHQWDCLHNNNYNFCVAPHLDPHHKGERLYYIAID